MNAQVAAFLTRSLRQESRLVSHHLLRATLAGFVFAILLIRIWTASLRAGAGGNFALDVMRACYWFVTLLGGIYFSTAIVEEKEEQTLPLLRMTGATPMSILLGKSVPRLACVLLFLMVITPFLFLSVTLGGLLMKGALTAALGILAYAVMFSQLGLLSSVISKDGQQAFGRTLLLWGLVEFMPTWAWLGSEAAIAAGGFSNLTQVQAAAGVVSDTVSGLELWKLQILSWLATWLSWAYVTTEPLVLQSNLSSYIYSFGAEPIWRPQMSAHLVIAVGLFGISWLMFERCTAQALAESPDSPKRLSRKVRRRVGDRALCWKSWQHLTGGWLWFWIRVIALPALICAFIYGVAWSIDEYAEPETYGVILMVAGGAILIAHVTILFGRIFGDEIHKKTLSSLLMLPIGRNRLIGDTILGLAPAILAATSCCAIGGTVLWNFERSFSRDFYELFEESWFYALATTVVSTIYLGLLLSIRMRYGGMLLAVVGVWFMSPFVIGGLMIVIELMVGGRGARTFFQHGLPWLLLQLEIPLCIWLHFRILRALDRAGELS